ncbi:MAG: glycosyltransferase [Terracidiphilus sp.]|jgi:glycosyltransferase involved in cell wall biosynthesis
MNITVLVCTYNRCLILPKTLDSLVAQRLPAGVEWEVVIVDNNSSDQTRIVVGDYMRSYPGRFRYLFEARQGLSRARNTGIKAARGEVIAFVDDDVIVEPTWLQNLTASLFSGNWAGAGGRIVPPNGFEPPEWLPIGGPLDLGGALALFDLGDQPSELSRAPYGTNMAFRKGAFDKYGMFRVELGRCGSNLISGEDTEFANRLMSAAEHLRYEPGAVVHHPIPEERLKKKYFRKWWFAFGRTRILERPARPSILGIPREFISIVNLVCHFLPVRLMRWLLAAKPKERFYQQCWVMLTLGEVVENYRTAESRRGTGLKTPTPAID